MRNLSNSVRITISVMVAAMLIGSMLQAQDDNRGLSSDSTNFTHKTPATVDELAQKQVVDRYMEPFLAQQHAPGAIVALSIRGKRTFYAYGNANDNGTPFTSSTIVEIGSCTKVFTTTLFALAIANQQIMPNESAQKYMPKGFILQPLAKQITPLELADHTSGMPFNPTNIPQVPQEEKWNFDSYKKWNIDSYSTRDFLNWVSKWQPASTPPAPYLYSNAGIALLGYLVANATGAPWEKQLNDFIAGPLGMKDTELHPNEEQMRRVATGHTQYGKAVPPWPVNAWFAAGSLRSTALDMLRFGEANLGHKQIDGKHISDQLISAMESAQRPIYIIPQRGGEMQGMAWVTNFGDQHAEPQIEVWKGGDTIGFSAVIVINPDKDTAIFIAVNQSGRSPKDEALQIGRNIP